MLNSRTQTVTEPNLLELIELARLSPSSHNTQPWRVRIQGEALVIGYEPSRQLNVGDPDKRELFISLGCFIETLARAAEGRGLALHSQYLGDQPEAVVEVSFQASEPSMQWDDLIRNRHSDRRPYEGRPLEPVARTELGAVQYGSARLLLIDKPEDIAFLATMTRDATASIMARQDFRDELSQWVRNNWTRQPDGMPGYTQGMPGPISLLAKHVIRRAGQQVAKDQAQKDSTRVQHSSAVGLILTDDESVASWIDAGRVYVMACLLALRHDIKTSGVSAAIIVPDTTAQIVTHFGLPFSPVALLRFGYVEKIAKHTPRRSVQDIVSA